MVVTGGASKVSAAGIASDYDRTKELKEFDESKAGVKGLVDSGLVKVPRIFIHPSDKTDQKPITGEMHPTTIPVIDLGSIHEDAIRHEEIVDQSATHRRHGASFR
uniref:Uncharacterized protein n=1 Tax=Nelumbo nucifera TaxID=4432 RepID=A0A822XJH5_NELNU|nr:TPA_asm: hypothetical protein HUJ06_021316 [Nelumbo nucifera]